jgi:hypothetical protein
MQRHMDLDAFPAAHRLHSRSYGMNAFLNLVGVSACIAVARQAMPYSALLTLLVLERRRR